jgi:hypothetical protein
VLFGIKLEGWLTITAIIAGPVLAFVVQDRRDKKREHYRRKREIFQTLLLTLKAQLAPRHVDALNCVPVEFYEYKKIMDAWKLYTAHLNDRSPTRDLTRWGEKKQELLIDLVHEIGVNLGFEHLDKATLRVNVYAPQGYEDNEEEMRQMRAAWLQVLKGLRPVPMTMVGPVQVEGALPSIDETIKIEQSSNAALDAQR